ncbi:unnamed protein product [Moneuplotes crassus]|uniref:Cyclic nucleotide-binding domain-containing protein n=1 Tax=Euplotes crassus TaxID=5936 RepID=A0AAD1UK69_EUPCR|nr:unnamed protein product [Moneuplotes crassus]
MLSTFVVKTTQQTAKKSARRRLNANIFDLEPKLLNDSILKVLSDPCNARKRADLLKLKDFFNDHEFFRELEENNEEDTVLKCFKAMKYVEHRKDDLIFKLGDEGFYFYIILKGEVGIKIMVTKEYEFTQNQYHKFLIKNYEEVCWEGIENGEELKSKVDSLMEKQNKKLTNRGSKNLINCNQSISMKDLKSFKIAMMKEVNVLGAGKCFGELALINSSKRAATIYCKTDDCSFAILSRDDFKEIAGKAEKKKLDKKINFLKRFEMFTEFTYTTLRKFSYFMDEQVYSKGGKVYSEGDIQLGIFLVLEGSFEIIQKNPMKVKQKLKNKIIKLKDKKSSLSVLKDLNYFRLASLTEGDLFGVEEVLQNVPRKNTVICTSGGYSTIYFLPSNQLLPLFKSKKSQDSLQKALSHQKSINSRIQQIIQVANTEESLLQKRPTSFSKSTQKKNCRIELKKKIITLSNFYKKSDYAMGSHKKVDKEKEKEQSGGKRKGIKKSKNKELLPEYSKKAKKRSNKLKRQITKLIRFDEDSKSRNTPTDQRRKSQIRTFHRKSKILQVNQQKFFETSLACIISESRDSYDDTTHSLIKIKNKRKEKKFKEFLSTEPTPKKRNMLLRIGYSKAKDSPLKISKLHKDNGNLNTSFSSILSKNDFNDHIQIPNNLPSKAQNSPSPLSKSQFLISPLKNQSCTSYQLSPSPTKPSKQVCSILRHTDIPIPSVPRMASSVGMPVRKRANEERNKSRGVKADVGFGKVGKEEGKRSLCYNPKRAPARSKHLSRNISCFKVDYTSDASEVVYKSVECEKEQRKQKIIDCRQKFTKIFMKTYSGGFRKNKM